MNRFPVAIALLLALAACDKKTAEVTSAPSVSNSVPKEKLAVDLSTPDSALKSWWRYQDERTARSFEECKDYLKRHEGETKGYAVYIQGTMLEKLSEKRGCTLLRYARDIQEVKVETETRAVAFAMIHNVTPIPEGAVPDELDGKWRKEGRSFKYLLEKKNGLWLISQVYEANSYPANMPWKPSYEPSDKPLYPAFVSPYDQ